MAERLTKRRIDTVKATIADDIGDRPYIALWDSSPVGLCLRLRKRGNGSWLFTYRPKKGAVTTAQNISLGKFPEISLDEARKLALGHAAQIARGTDPRAEIKLERLKAESSIAASLDDYLDHMTGRGLVNRDQMIGVLRRGFKPMLGTDIDKLTLRDVVDLTDRIAKSVITRKNGTSFKPEGAAREFRKLCYTFLGWNASRGAVPVNVLAGVRAPRKSKAERQAVKLREGRALDDRELGLLWKACDTQGVFGALVQFGILSGLRRTELASLRWSDITDTAIVIDEDRTKGGREHRVPLTDRMRDILSQQPKGSELVFASVKTRGALSGWSKMLPKLLKAANGLQFRLHDLRRTTRTLMSRLGVSEAVAEAAIGHINSNVLVGLYNKDTMWLDRAKAFEAVSNHIGQIVAGDDGASNVVTLRQAQ